MTRKSESVYGAAYAAHYDALYLGPKYREDLDKISAYLDEVGPEARILDVGCGTGTHCSLLHESHPRVAGLDLSEAMLRRAREKNPGVAFTRGSVLSQDLFSPESFDLVFSFWDVFNYLEDEEEMKRAFGHCARWLRPGGWFCVELIVDDGDPSLRPQVYPPRRVDKEGLRIQRSWDLRDSRRLRFEERIESSEGSTSASHELLTPPYENVESWLLQAGLPVRANEGDRRNPIFCCRRLPEARRAARDSAS